MQNRLKKMAKEVREELIKLAPIFYGVPAKTLCGLCGFGSAMLFERFKKEGLDVQIANAVGHWFVVCEGFLVDVTATQFGQAKICVRDYEKTVKKVQSGEYKMEWWNAKTLSKTLNKSGLSESLDSIKKARVGEKK